MSKDKLLFNYLNSINLGKRDFLLDEKSEECARFKKEYVPYVINQFMAGSIDTLILANEMNISYYIPARRQFLFLLYSVRKRKRFTKWPRGKVNKDVDIVARHYSISNKRAKEYISLMAKEDMDSLRDMYAELDSVSA